MVYAAAEDLPEFTILALLVQAMASFVGLLLANILYLAGPILDMALAPSARPSFRQWSYPIGIVFSVAVVVVLPVWNFVNAVLYAIGIY